MLEWGNRHGSIPEMIQKGKHHVQKAHPHLDHGPVAGPAGTVYAKPAAQMTAALEDFQYSTLGVTTVRQDKRRPCAPNHGPGGQGDDRLQRRFGLCGGDAGRPAGDDVAGCEARHRPHQRRYRGALWCGTGPPGPARQSRWPPDSFQGQGRWNGSMRRGNLSLIDRTGDQGPNRGKLFLRLDIDHSSAGVISSIEGQGLLVVGN